MRIKPTLKYALPFVMVVIALWLIHLGAIQERRLEEAWDVAYAAPAWHLADAINAPFRPLWRACRVFEQPWNICLALALVAALWFWVVRNVSSLLKTGRIATLKSLPLRLTIDLVLFLDGIYCGYLGFESLIWVCKYGNWSSSHYSHLTPAEWMMELAVGLSYVTWAIALVLFFGRDIVQSIRELLRTSPPAIPTATSNS